MICRASSCWPGSSCLDPLGWRAWSPEFQKRALGERWEGNTTQADPGVTATQGVVEVEAGHSPIHPTVPLDEGGWEDSWRPHGGFKRTMPEISAMGKIRAPGPARALPL